RDCVKLRRGTHPDLITVGRQSSSAGELRREIRVEQVREIVSGARILPNESRRKVYLIREADTMNPSAQNALLKLLEEPPRFVALLLLCENPGALLETVRSRCALARASGRDEREADPAALENAQKYLRAAAKRDELELLRVCNSLSALTGAQAAAFTGAALELTVDMLSRRRERDGLSEGELLHISRLLLRARDYLRSNVGVKHVFGLLSVRTIN
ncbi:MAG: hypothetical protein NC319_07465, partial [Butyricicoccus sp.]|nr:hypothetical protein [Butyricicoccus sp.]